MSDGQLPVFEPVQPSEMAGPSRVQDANWIGWQITLKQASLLAYEKDQLNKQLHVQKDQSHEKTLRYVRENEMLKQVVATMQHERVIANSLSSLFFALSGIAGSFAIWAATSNTSRNWLIFTITVTIAFLILGFISLWFRLNKTAMSQKDVERPIALDALPPE